MVGKTVVSYSVSLGGSNAQAFCTKQSSSNQPRILYIHVLIRLLCRYLQGKYLRAMTFSGVSHYCPVSRMGLWDSKTVVLLWRAQQCYCYSRHCEERSNLIQTGLVFKAFVQVFPVRICRRNEYFLLMPVATFQAFFLCYCFFYTVKTFVVD